MINIGLNTVHHDIKSIFNLGMTRVELCLGRAEEKAVRMNQIKSELIRLSTLEKDYTIHHPIYMPDFFKHDYLESFFLEPDEEKRESSFLLLEENLKLIRSLIDESPTGKPPEYIVVHFPGVYPASYLEKDEFLSLLKSSFDRVWELGKKYGLSLALEYFGSNIMFYEPYRWIEEIKSREGLKLLVDTGHLYFASIMRDFDFMAAYNYLLPEASGVHLWTTASSKHFVEDENAIKEFSKTRPHYKIEGSKDVYGANEFYRRYHHVAISLEQTTDEGWAFDSRKVLSMALDRKLPIILEATPYYGGTQYYIDSMKEIIEYANNYQKHEKNIKKSQKSG